MVTQTAHEAKTNIFEFEKAALSTGTAPILRGGRHLFELLPLSFDGVRTITIVGWGPQGSAQSCNVRDSLKAAGSDIVVRVGLREGSDSLPLARAAGFSEEDGTLGEMHEFIKTSDVVINLTSDGAMTELWKTIMDEMKPGATLGLSHGFLLAYLQAIGERFRDDINVVLMAPKGMGKSVRDLYLQGASKKGAGINSSVAVEQDVDGRAENIALGWAVANGSPATFFTTMINEVRSDLFGERGMLLGGLWALVEVLYKIFVKTMSEEQAFLHAVKGLTGIVSRLMSEKGLKGVYQEFSDRQCGREFRAGYNRAYGAIHNVMLTLYDDIESGREIKRVVEASKAPMSNIEASPMWEIGKGLYDSQELELDKDLAFAAGALIAGIMAQMDVLRSKGHNIAEIVNESFIEIIDSLIPFMDKSGVRRMVDGCSITARVGTRLWGPVFMAALEESMNARNIDEKPFERFLEDPIHQDIDVLFGYRPSVKIAVEPE